MQRSGLGDAPRTLLEEFGKIQSGDVVLKAMSGEGDSCRQIRLRCVVEPDGAQKALLSRLGLTLPRRLRRIDEEPGTEAQDHGRPHPAFARDAQAILEM